MITVQRQSKARAKKKKKKKKKKGQVGPEWVRPQTARVIHQPSEKNMEGTFNQSEARLTVLQ